MVQRRLRAIKSGLVDGLIAELPHASAKQVEGLARRLADRNPMVIFHPTVRPKRFSVFRHDAAMAIGEVLQSLYDSGHRRIAYIQHAALGENTRVNAYIAFLKTAGLPFDPTLMVDGA